MGFDHTEDGGRGCRTGDEGCPWKERFRTFGVHEKAVVDVDCV